MLLRRQSICLRTERTPIACGGPSSRKRPNGRPAGGSGRKDSERPERLSLSVPGRDAFAPATAVQNRSIRFCRTPSRTAVRFGSSQSHQPYSIKQKAPRSVEPFALYGAPGEIRTPDLLVRSQTLYPTELRAQKTVPTSILTIPAEQASPGQRELWRRERDSNPRWAFDPYALSRGAPSTTRPSLRDPQPSGPWS